MPESVASRKFHNLFRPVWTHQSIARALGCSRQLVTDWINGKRTPTPEAVAALWELLARAPLARLNASPEARLSDWEARVVAALPWHDPPWGPPDREVLRAACLPRWRQSELAQVLGRSRQCVCSYASGKIMPSGRIAAQIEGLEPEIKMAEWFQ